jgi:hypothetical protein
LRPEDRWILPILANYAGSLVADRGGPDAMTAGEAHMIELAQLARGCTMLVLAQARAGPVGCGARGRARGARRARRRGRLGLGALARDDLLREGLFRERAGWRRRRGVRGHTRCRSRGPLGASPSCSRCRSRKDAGRP